MIRREGDALLIDGPVTLDNVPALLEAGADEIRAGVATVDLSGVTSADSSALALLLAWMREAKANNAPATRMFSIRGMPQSMANLADLYSITDYLPARS